MRAQRRSLLAPSSSTRLWLKVALMVAGVLAGAVFGVALTKFGKLIAGAPPATFDNHVWNAVTFGVLAGIVSPLVSWWALRRAPLWRTIVEPLGYAVAGGAMAILIGVPVLILLLPPVGLILGFFRLRRRYPEPRPLRYPAPRPLFPIQPDVDD